MVSHALTPAPFTQLGLPRGVYDAVAVSIPVSGVLVGIGTCSHANSHDASNQNLTRTIGVNHTCQLLDMNQRPLEYAVF